METGSDFFFNGFGFLGHAEATFKSHNYFFFGGSGFAFGPVVNYNSYREDLKEYSAGGGIRMGQNTFLELDGGYFKRTHDGFEGKGFLASLIIGWQLTKGFRVILPFHFIHIKKGDLIKHWVVDFVPNIGLRLVI